MTAYARSFPLATAHGRTVEEADRELRKVVDAVIAGNRRQTWEGFKSARVLGRKVVAIEGPD